ncbi:MAG: shikimate kinase, partial [Candidatus Helarchaeota archaeon]
EKRPLLNKPDPMGEIHKLLKFRAPFYYAATEHQIDTTQLTVEEVVQKIIEIYNST